jgi:hypothetical protein
MFSFFIYFYIAIIFLVIIGAILFVWKKYYSGHSKQELEQALHFILYEISFSSAQTKDQDQDFKKAIGIMEQFYSGMIAVEPYFVLEIGLPYTGNEIVFYCAVPKERSSIFEKQVQGLYPEAKVSVKTADYNIFRPQGYSLASIVKLKKDNVLPIKTYDKFEADPLQVIINTFSKLQKEGEGAAMQLIVHSNTSRGDLLMGKVKSALFGVKQGQKLEKALHGANVGMEFLEGFGHAIFGAPEKPKDDKPKPVDDDAVKMLDAKTSKRILTANMRLLVSAESQIQADSILKELESAFLQFHETHGNSVTFSRPEGHELQSTFYNFSFRIPDNENLLLLNTGELSSLLHFPSKMSVSTAPQLKSTKTVENAPPLDLPSHGLLLGRNVYRGEEKDIYMTDEDRLRHLYILGQTGTGKTHLLKNLIDQDIKNGKGVCFIDPHGSDIQDVLAAIPPERIDDVIYFDPANTARPMGLNMIEYDPLIPEQKDFVVSEMLGIFKKLFDMGVAGGPAFEQYFVNSLLLVMDTPETGNTLLEVARVLTNKEFRMKKLETCKNPIVANFWREMAEKTTGDTSLANMAPYITNKFDSFLSNETMRPIVLQEKSSFNIRDIMDNKKILLVNLSKGRLGERNAYLLGMIIVGRFLMAALSRSPKSGEQEKDYPPFYLYLDEFQNFTTDSIAQILSEARKYKLSLTLAHQVLAQVDEKIKSVVFGNVGSMAIFRIGSEDAQVIEKFYEPTFKAVDFVNIDNKNAYLRILNNGQPARPFNIKTVIGPQKNPAIIGKIAELSALKYGRPREEVETEIREKYLNK